MKPVFDLILMVAIFSSNSHPMYLHSIIMSLYDHELDLNCIPADVGMTGNGMQSSVAVCNLISLI